MGSNSSETGSDNSLGFVCPKCGVRLGVFTTRKTNEGIIERVRKCPSCGEIKLTVEHENYIGWKQVEIRKT